MSPFVISHWGPARRPASPVLAQVASPPSTLERMMGDPVVALVTDIAAISVGASLVYALSKNNTPWSTFWVIVTTAATVKAFHDGNRL